MQRSPSAEVSSRAVRLRLTSTLTASAAILLAVACTTPSAPVIVKLEISELGAYAVDGSLVQRMALTDALLAKRQHGKLLLVHVIPSSKANYEAVEAAVRAARDSGASIGMVGNERF